MIIRIGEARIREAGNMSISNYVTKETSKGFSLAVVALRGLHGKVRSSVSDRGYYILQGRANVFVGDESSEVSVGDAVFIPAGTWHAIEGDVKYCVINSPAFDPKFEETFG